MRFQVLDIIPHQSDPITGLQVDTAQRFEQVVQSAVRAEELGFDSFSVGERHAGAFISSLTGRCPWGYCRTDQEDSAAHRCSGAFHP